ncbi:MAG TPA: response regulator [Candidatus Polarisedimenticolaceae bacterium]
MRRTLLIADDSVTIRKVVEITFADSDLRVETAGSGQEALDKIARLRPDLVLADVVMPEPAGYEICRVVKASEHPVPVVLLAGTFEPFDADRAAACGADAHLVKPFDTKTLVDEVARLLAPRGIPAPVVLPLAEEEDELEAVLDEMAGRVRPEPEPPRAPEPVVEAVPASAEPAPAPAEPVPAPERTLTDADVEAIARLVVAKLSEPILREIAWEVVPDLAEAIVRERLRQLERDEREVR